MKGIVLFIWLLSIGFGYGNAIDTQDDGLADHAWDSIDKKWSQLHKDDLFVGFDSGSNKLADTFDIDDSDIFLAHNSTGLQEFEPIRNTIIQSETQYYSFRINTTDGLGHYYEFLIFLSGNICSQPDNVYDNQTNIAVYYSFNASMFQDFSLGQMKLFQNGYFQALAEAPLESINNDDSTGENNPDNDFSILYIGVRAPENTNRTAQWSYQIGVSQNDLVFQWDDRTWAQVIDTDSDSALITTGNLTAPNDMELLNITKSQYSLHIYSYDYVNYFNQLNSSWCAIRKGPALYSRHDIETSYTNRLGFLQQQFYVTGLNASTKYIAYLLSDFKGSTYGGAVYRPFEIETMDNDACQLIYDLQFCDKVSYSVPASSSLLSISDLKSLYDEQAEAYYTNFTKALDQIACNTTDDAEFSPMKTCQDCANMYKEWLCSVTIPRCSTRNQTGYIFRDKNESRNDFLNDIVQPQPYFEILPCIDVCNAMVRDCPADFGFFCPTKDYFIEKSYYWWDPDSEWPSCNYYNTNLLTSNAPPQFTLHWWLIFSWFIVYATM